MNLESVICYIDIESDNKEVKTEIVENGFSPEQEEGTWDNQLAEEAHLTNDGEMCPVGPQKAALLYPLCSCEGNSVHLVQCECLYLNMSFSNAISCGIVRKMSIIRELLVREVLSRTQKRGLSVERLFRI